MQIINFDEGLKSFAINGDENRVIYFNPGDLNLSVRAQEAAKRIKDGTEAFGSVPLNPDGTIAEGEEGAVCLLEQFESLVRQEINYIFNADVYDVAFNHQSPLCIVGRDKQFLVEAFVGAVMKVIESEVAAFEAASQKRVEKYTKGYVK